MQSQRTGYLVGLIVALFIIGGGIWLAADPVRAALGNTGTPVRCRNTGITINPGESVFLTCTPADGSSTWSEGRVPEGKYLMVTDIHISPEYVVDTNQSMYVTLYAAYGENNRSYGLQYNRPVIETYSQHYTTPLMILPEGYRIEAVHGLPSGPRIEVEVSGLLVSNVDYLPVVVGQ
jgi:hypothetical protein